MAIKKYIQGSIFINGTKIDDVNEFKPPTLKKEIIEIETVETRVATFNDLKFENAEGMIKINGWLPGEIQATFLSGVEVQMRSKQVYQALGAIPGANNINQKQVFNWDITGVIGGVDQESQSSGDGAMVECPYLAHIVALKDRNGNELFSYSFLTNITKVNGKEVDADIREA